MIFQNFNKGGTERVNYGLYEYPPGADLIFDFGNPACTSAFNTSRIVYNVGLANVTGSLQGFGVGYPVLNTGAGSAGGNMAVTTSGGGGYNQMTWSFQSTENQTSVVVSAKNPAATFGAGLGWSPYVPSVDSIQLKVADAYFYSYIDVPGGDPPTFTVAINNNVNNGRNGWNIFGTIANDSTNHQYWENGVLKETDATNITRTTTAAQANYFGHRAGLKYLAFLQYPRILSPKEMRQINKVFSQRFFT
jgi:hypothetical protein